MPFGKREVEEAEKQQTKKEARTLFKRREGLLEAKLVPVAEQTALGEGRR